MPEVAALGSHQVPGCPVQGACARLQGVAGQVKDRVERAAAAELEPFTRPLLLFPEVSYPATRHLTQCLFSALASHSEPAESHASADPSRPSLCRTAWSPRRLLSCSMTNFIQGTTSNGKCILPFKTGAFLAGAPVQPVVIKYGPDRVSPAWDSVGALWHVFLMLANPCHSVTARQVRTSPSRTLVPVADALPAQAWTS